MINKSVIIVILFFLFLSFGFTTQGQDNLIINELLAINDNILQDEDGDNSDWIEIKNIGSLPISLNGWFLTDDSKSLLKWAFPNAIIQPQEILIVFASGKNLNQNIGMLHTNFKLSSSGEYLALVKSNAGKVVGVYDYSFPKQFPDISWGYISGGYNYQNSPTPGAENINGSFVAPPSFSVAHGHFFNSFNLVLSCSTPNSEIYYTTDASTPSKTNGTKYSQEIKVDSTIVVRAKGYVGQKSSWSVTQTYLFPHDVIRQPEYPAGYPKQWLEPKGNSEDYVYIQSEYGMTQGVVDHPVFSKVIIQAITELPVVSIVSDRENFFSESMDPDSGGIYIYTGASIGSTSSLLYHIGNGWARPASIEYFNGKNNDINFQENCVIELHGGASRTVSKTNKHSFKVGFKSEYGPSRLNYKVLGKGTPDKYDWLVLRGGFAHRYGLQVKDPFSKSTMRDMGQYSAFSQFIHVYLNGMYWGMYNLCERMDDNTVSEHFGGSSEDYDIVKDYYEVGAGDTVAWSKLMKMTRENIRLEDNYQKILGRNADGSRNTAYEVMLDAENFVDYYLCNMYIGNTDWDHHNWLAARRKTNPEGFKFMVWDCEYVLNNADQNSLKIFNKNRPTEIFYNLIKNNSFKNLFISRVNKHFFGEGALTPNPCYKRYTNWLNVIDTAIVAESARWSPDDFKEKDIWESVYHQFIDDYFPVRTENVLKQFINAGYYPSINPPVFNTKGEILPRDFELKITSTDGGDIYYTIDEGDPAYFSELGNAPVISYDGKSIQFPKDTIEITARVKKDSIWSIATTKKFILKSPNSVIQHLTDQGEFHLFSYPNPASDVCNIEFSLPESSDIEITIYDMMGKRMFNIQNGLMPQGKHTVTWQTNNAPGGIYFCEFKNNSCNSVHRIKILK